MDHHDIVVIGSSAGGVNALRALLASLPRDLNASIFVVQHVSADSESFLPSILSAAGEIPASHPVDGEQIQRGRIYVARPDHHLIVYEDTLLVKKGPKENRFRPSIDVTMRSAAYEFGPRVIGIVLTGRLNDGTSGLWAIHEMGGITIVQNPEDALYPDMPSNVLRHMEVDFQVPLAEIAALLVKLVNEPVAPAEDVQNKPDAERLKVEIEIAAEKNALEMGITNMGEPTNLTCPECGGTLVSLQEGKLVRYRCHTGHAYSSDSLWQGISESIETNLWQALRSVEEGIIFFEQSATRCQTTGNEDDATRFMQDASELRKKAKMLLEFIYQ